MRPLNKTYEAKIFRAEIESEHTMWWDYYDYYDDFYYDQFDDYGYLNKDIEKEIFLETICGPRYRRLKNLYLPYRAIDMQSFYSKSVLRERKINDLLGLPGGTGIIEKPKIGDLIKKDVYNS